MRRSIVQAVLEKAVALSLCGLLLTLSAGAASAQTPPAAATAPRASYAWVTFDRRGVIGAGASGLADRAASRALTVDQPMRIASISKLVVALGVMRLVERGQLDLDADVSRYLGWRLRHPAFPDRAITLRMLLSHTGGLKDRGDGYSVPLGEELRDLIERDDGWDAEHAPGSYFRYANVNFPVIASIMERATGERFDRLMLRLVFRPLSLDACFGWATCSVARTAAGVTLYHPDGSVRYDGAEARASRCPVASRTSHCDLARYVPGTNGSLFSPQGGLRISARDLAVIGRMMLNLGRHGGGVFLRSASLDAMARPAWRFDGSNGDTSGGFFCAYGLAVQSLANPRCDDDLFTGRRRAIGHAGEAYGMLSGLWIDPAAGRGIVYLISNNDDAGLAGSSTFRPIERSLARKLTGIGADRP